MSLRALLGVYIYYALLRHLDHLVPCHSRDKYISKYILRPTQISLPHYKDGGYNDLMSGGSGLSGRS